MCPDMLPVGHEVLAPEDEEEVEAAGPQTHGHPVVLHPEPVLGVLELLTQQLQSTPARIKELRYVTV